MYRAGTTAKKELLSGIDEQKITNGQARTYLFIRPEELDSH